METLADLLELMYSARNSFSHHPCGHPAMVTTPSVEQRRRPDG